MNVRKIKAMKGKERIVMVTAYDAPSARIAWDAGIKIILVGDSVANTVLGYSNTLPVTMEEMMTFVAAVKRGAPDAFVIADMPFLSYQVSEEEALKNAGKFVKECGADAVKLEGGREIVGIVRKLVDFGIPVMGHLGFTPQYVHTIGGYRVRGKEREEKERILEDAQLLEEAGVFALVLEMMVENLAKLVTEQVSVPTIGIGSGRYCDGQVLVWHDIMGINPDFKPRFAKSYVNLYEICVEAIKQFIDEVRKGDFPEEKHVFKEK